jgi:hypothetical protein
MRQFDNYVQSELSKIIWDLIKVKDGFEACNDFYSLSNYHIVESSH